MMKKYALLLAAIVALTPLAGVAKEKPEWRSWPLGDRFFGTVAWFRPNLDTEVGISDSSGNIGALINLNQAWVWQIPNRRYSPHWVGGFPSAIRLRLTILSLIARPPRPVE